MNWLTVLLQRSMQIIGGFMCGRNRKTVKSHLTKLSGLSREELAEQARLAIAAKADPQKLAEGKSKNSVTATVAQSIFRRLGRSASAPADIDFQNLALGIAAFRQAPADLPPGSFLYREQVQAAVQMLSSSCVLQMETGEGKTYALLPVAFTFLCRYGKVYVVCANDYLALRDAERTKPYWEFLGASVGLGLDGRGLSKSEWSRDVVYTTTESMLFHALRDENSFRKPAHPISFGAVIIDEIDATLLDDGNQKYSISETVRSEDFDWATILTISNQLVEGEHIDVDRDDMTASLTIDGEDFVRSQLQSREHASNETYLLTRQLVEYAYIGTQVVQEDVDYKRIGNRIHTIDSKSGEIRFNRTVDWQIPLEASLGIPSRPRDIYVHSCTPSVFYRDFKHLVGLSGTASAETFEYLYRFGLPTFSIPRRCPRHDGHLPNVVYESRKAAINYICEYSMETVKNGRPVMIGTQSIKDASDVFHALQRFSNPNVRLRLLTGEDDNEMFEAFQHAGDLNSILVATQRAGRGIDIRLSDEAKQNGGIVLIGFSRAVEARLDQQFLGRVGRQDDPYTSFFVCSLEDELFRMFAGPLVKKILAVGGFKDDVAMESPMVDRRLAGVQRQRKIYRMQNGIGQVYLNDAGTVVRGSIRNWFEYFQIELDSRQQTYYDYPCTHSSLEYAITRLLDNPDIAELFDSRPLSSSEAEGVAQFLATAFDTTPDQLCIKSEEIEGYDGEEARNLIRNRLITEINTAMETNRAVRKQVEAQRMEYWRRKAEIDRCANWQNRLNKLIEKFEQEQAVETPAITDASVDSESNGTTVIRGPIDPLDKPYVFGETEPHSEKPKSLQQLHAEVVKQNEYLANHERAHPDVALRKVVEKCTATGLDELIEPLLIERRIYLKQRLANPFENGVEASQLEQTEWSLSLAELVLAGDFSLDDAIQEVESRADFAEEMDRRPDLALRAQNLLQIVEDQVATMRSELTRFAHEVKEAWLRRDPARIANRTIKMASTEFLDGKSRLIHEASQIQFNPLRYHRQVYDRLLRLWNDIDAKLPGQIIANLLKGADPGALDELFWNVDHDAPSHSSARRSRLNWKPDTSISRASQRNEQNEEIIDQFLIRNEAEARKRGLAKSDLRRTLRDFLNESPTYTLRTPKLILAAVDNAYLVDRRRGVTMRRARLNRKWIRKFLVFLRHRNLIGKLPTLQTRYYDAISRMTASLTDRNSTLFLLPAILTVGLLVLASWFRVTTAIGWEGLPGFFERLAFGPLLQWGAITIPAIGGFVIGRGLTRLIQPRMKYLPSSEGFGKFLVPIAQLGLAIWITQWTAHASWSEFMGAVGLFFLMIAISILVNRITKMTAIFSGIGLISGWLVVTSGLVAWPWLVAQLPGSSLMVSYVILAAFVGLYYLCSYFNFGEIEVESSHLPSTVDVSRQGGRSLFQTAHLVRGDCGVFPHVYGLLLAAPVFLLLNGWEHAVLATHIVYAGTVATWCWTMISRRFSPALWHEQLNAKRQVMKDVSDRSMVPAILIRIRNKVLIREIVFHLGIFFALVFLTHGILVQGGTFPIAPLLLVAAMLIADHLRGFSMQVYRHMLSRVAVVNTELDLADLPEPVDSDDWWDRFKHFVKNRCEIILFIVSAVIAMLTYSQKLIAFFTGPGFASLIRARDDRDVAGLNA